MKIFYKYHIFVMFKHLFGKRLIMCKDVLLIIINSLYLVCCIQIFNKSFNDRVICFTLSRFKVSVTDSPTISLTPPHSLEYVCSKGGASPNGSVTPNGMASNKSASTVLLSPSYLQNPCQCNQSIKVSMSDYLQNSILLTHWYVIKKTTIAVMFI